MATYQSVNSQWPDGTRDGRDLKPTPQEAMAAAKRLYRFAMKKPWPGKVVITSGNRYTWVRNRVLYVNPDYRDGGWHELVHLMSHLCTQRLFPNASGHGHQHAFLEKEMIAYVVASGWLDGKLRTVPKPVLDKAAIKRTRAAAAIQRWEAKQRRAVNALKKLRRQVQRMERTAPATV